MKILDKYIIREYLRTFALTLLFFVALVITVRLFDKELGRLLSRNISFVNAVKIMLFKSPRRIVEVIPAASFLAAFLMLGRLVHNNELSAMKSAGISVYRIITLIAGVMFFVSILTLIFNDRVASRGNLHGRMLEKRIRYHKNRDILFKDKNSYMYYIQTLSLKDQRMRNVTIYRFNPDQQLRSKTYAKLILFSSIELNSDKNYETRLKHTWTLKDGWHREIEDGKEKSFSKFDVKIIQVDVDPELLADSDLYPREMTYTDLARQVKYKKDAGQVVRVEQVEMQHRLAYPFASFVVVLIGATLAIQFGKVGVAVGFLITMFISFLYWGIAIATFEALGENGRLPPIVACWAANVLFIAVGLFLMWKVRK